MSREINKLSEVKGVKGVEKGARTIGIQVVNVDIKVPRDNERRRSRAKIRE